MKNMKSESWKQNPTKSAMKLDKVWEFKRRIQKGMRKDERINELLCGHWLKKEGDENEEGKRGSDEHVEISEGWILRSDLKREDENEKPQMN